MNRYIITFFLISIFIIASCEFVPTKEAENSAEFQLVNSQISTSESVLYILYNSGFAGYIKYFRSTVDLGITTETEFNSNSASKSTATIQNDGLDFNNYLKIEGLSAETLYYVYILNTQTGEVTSLTGTTKPNSTPGRDQINGTITGTYGSYAYKITFPAGYSTSSSTTWPFLIALKCPAFEDTNSPFVIFYVDVYSSPSATDFTEIDNIKSVVKSFIEDSTNRINKNKIYTFGFSAGGNASILIANDDGSSQYNIKAVVTIGITSWLKNYCSNLGNSNVWMLYGTGDSIGDQTPIVFNSLPSGSGEHLLTGMPGIGHDCSPAYSSPIVLNWILSK